MLTKLLLKLQLKSVTAYLTSPTVLRLLDKHVKPYFIQKTHPVLGDSRLHLKQVELNTTIKKENRENEYIAHDDQPSWKVDKSDVVEVFGWLVSNVSVLQKQSKSFFIYLLVS